MTNELKKEPTTDHWAIILLDGEYLQIKRVIESESEVLLKRTLFRSDRAIHLVYTRVV